MSNHSDLIARLHATEAMILTDLRGAELQGVRIAIRQAADALHAQDAHRQIDTPNWDTKIRCACGYESVSRCEWALHAIKAMQQ